MEDKLDLTDTIIAAAIQPVRLVGHPAAQVILADMLLLVAVVAAAAMAAAARQELQHLRLGQIQCKAAVARHLEHKYTSQSVVAAAEELALTTANITARIAYAAASAVMALTGTPEQTDMFMSLGRNAP